MGIKPYLHFGMINPEGAIISFTYVQENRSQQVESQLFRRVIAEIVYNRPEPSFWHWRDIATGLTSQNRLEELKANTVRLRKRLGL